MIETLTTLCVTKTLIALYQALVDSRIDSAIPVIEQYGELTRLNVGYRTLVNTKWSPSPAIESTEWTTVFNRAW